MAIWNPWHGCKKYSSGCQNCYVYRRDSQFGKDSSIVTKTADFGLPLKKNRSGEYKLTEKDNPVYTCMTSDFFIDEADAWRDEIWEMIFCRPELHFVIITKRALRIEQCLPVNWGEGYENVTLVCTCENQSEADKRLPVFLSLPALHKEITHEPMLSKIDISSYLASGQISRVICGGESGSGARICDYDWILDTRRQCIEAGVSFYFKQTGAKFRKDGRVYNIERKYQHSQADKAGINYEPDRIPEVLQRLSRSDFRAMFHLNKTERLYIEEKGLDTIRSHAEYFIDKRLAPAVILNDGKQTPMRGHPVFIAQHACACCCRGCLEKWHHIEKGHTLTGSEKEYIINVLMSWIEIQLNFKEKTEE